MFSNCSLAITIKKRYPNKNGAQQITKKITFEILEIV